VVATYEYAGVEYATRSEMCKARRDHYFGLRKSGLNSTAAAKIVGVSKRTAKVWRNGRTRATGRNESPTVDWYRGDMELPKVIHHRYLNQDERLAIADGTRNGQSARSIAQLLNRNVTTITRELARGTNPKTGHYEPYYAQQQSTLRLARPKQSKILKNKTLFKRVKSGLEKGWSPEQISGRLREDYGNNSDMYVCHETIYQAIYVQARGELKLEVTKALRSGRATRRTQAQPQERKSRFREPMIMISERPPEIEDRAIPGHWEGDLIAGKQNKSAIGTLVERQSRFTVLLHLPDKHDAESVQAAIVSKLQNFPKLLRNSLTWDQGSELALHANIKTALDMDVYFCDPHSPWQRGTNENTNGLLREYFPKGTDLSQYSEKYLDAVADELNDRPRKVLQFKKPAEKILEIIQ